MSKIISANRLNDGLVVYLATDGWTADIDEAKRFAADAEVEAGLHLAKADEKRNLIVDSFAVEIKTPDSQKVEALTLRNAIRAKGPTVDYLPRPNASPRS